jgi:hypothetical protein
MAPDATSARIYTYYSKAYAQVYPTYFQQRLAIRD